MSSVEPMIDAGRFAAFWESFIPYGGTPDNGMHRLTLSAEDGAARDALARWMSENDVKLTVDPMGNMFGLLDLAGPDAPIVMTGSHLDSQPRGGRYDGAYGVLASCEAAKAVAEKLKAEGIASKCNLAIVNWTNEEGARFQPSILGSSVYSGAMDLDFALDRRDGDGISVRDSLKAIGYDGAGKFPYPKAYVEIHVEGDKVLDSKGLKFGALTRHWGAIKYRLAFIGRQSHTAPTPMAERRDALLGAARLIECIRGYAGAAKEVLHTSVGRLEVRPNSPNIVPSEAVMFIELRSADQPTLEATEAAMLKDADRIAAQTGLTYEVRAIDRRYVGHFDPRLIALATEEARVYDQPVQPIDCVGANDANCMIPLCPTIVINVPSRNGVIHHPEEFTSQADMELGADWLARILFRLCRDGVEAIR
jgi:beta-ureidopropionase / N-carbamoyl-L-amino-acid hydrolase